MTPSNTPHADLLTVAETSAFLRTGRTDEVERLCAAYAQAWPDVVHSFEYGRSAEGRPMQALIVSRTGALSAADLKRRAVPLLMLQAGIHPGESDGKDAGFMALRDLLGAAGQDLLDRVAILFVPAFNVDGHERFGAWNRPNQRGPQEMGWRATAQNLNLNRDYTKADAPEMQAMLRLLNEWDPLVCADLHVTDGADFEPDISIQVEPVHQGDPQLYASGIQLRDELIAKLAARGSLPLPFYPDLVQEDDPASGFHLTVYSPRFSSGYFPARNRFTVLVETHSWKDYATRVRVTRNTILGLTELVAAHGSRWLDEVQRADARALQLAGTDVVLDYASGWREPTAPSGRGTAATPDDRTAASSPSTDTSAASGADPYVTMIEFRGYAYTRKPSDISGGLVTAYDPTRPQIWRVPFRRNVQPSVIVPAPGRGYIVPVAYAQEIAGKLQLHGIEFELFAAADAQVGVRVFRASRTQFSATPFEGRMRVTLHGAWQPEQHVIPPGSLFVPIEQARARLAMVLLEPQSPDSFAAWGFFNGCFEQKEYLEPYVAEIIARDMLTSDPALRAQFQRKLAEEPAFAASPSARLEFFLSRHASRDDRFNLYPVFRLEQGAS